MAVAHSVSLKHANLIGCDPSDFAKIAEFELAQWQKKFANKPPKQSHSRAKPAAKPKHPAHAGLKQ
jgi:hypothetical protein